MSLRKTGLAIALAIAIFPSLLQAHGGLPVAQQILWRDQTMLVPTPFWGLFVGTDGGPFHWICEEIINLDQQRRFALGQDGTLYATDRSGVTVSRDNGCSWAAVTSGINTHQVLAVLADPASPRVWALATAPSPMDTGLFRSDDAGRSWQSHYVLTDHWLSGRILALTSMAPGTPRQPTLHVSRDGANFTALPVSYKVNGADIGTIIPLWIDPRAPNEIYVATKDAATNVLLRIGQTGAATEVMRVNTAIRDMTRDPRNDQLLVGTSQGLWAGQGGAMLQPLNTVSSAQCLSMHGDALYACAWNYSPDMAALARLSDDATRFTKVFQFHETMGPIDCPASTPAGELCPKMWLSYADQLGVDLGLMKNMPPAEADGCHVAPRAPSRAGGLFILLGWLFALAAWKRIRSIAWRVVQTGVWLAGSR
jgi:hypothetical protein